MNASISACQIRRSLYRLIDQAAESHQPILISGKRASAVLVLAENWQAIQEPLLSAVQEQKTVRVLRIWTHYE